LGGIGDKGTIAFVPLMMVFMLRFYVEMPMPTIQPSTAIEIRGKDSIPLREDNADLLRLLRHVSNDELAPLLEYILEKGA